MQLISCVRDTQRHPLSGGLCNRFRPSLDCKETLIFVAHTPGGQLPSRDMNHVR